MTHTENGKTLVTTFEMEDVFPERSEEYQLLTTLVGMVQEMRAEMALMSETIESMRVDINTSKGFIETISEQVMPTLDALKKSPMLKMLFPKEK